MLYKSWKMPGIGERPIWVIVDENDDIVNKIPTKEELNCLKVSKLKTYKSQSGLYNHTNTCPRCEKENRITKLSTRNARREYNKEGRPTGRWICKKHYERDYQRNNPNSMNNIKKSLRNYKIETSNTKGDRCQKIACILKGYKDLNSENDNHRSPIDCIDPKTGLYYQIKGKWYDHQIRCWQFVHLEKEWSKQYEDMCCYCISDDGKMIERIYIFPSWETIGRKSIGIYKYNKAGKPYDSGWYEKYRIMDDELKRSNKIWEDLIANC